MRGCNKEIVDFRIGRGFPEAPTSITGGSEYQKIQHRASDQYYADRQNYNRNEIRIAGGFEGSDRDDVGNGELQYILRQCGVEQTPPSHSIPRRVCHGIAS